MPDSEDDGKRPTYFELLTIARGLGYHRLVDIDKTKDPPLFTCGEVCTQAELPADAVILRLGPDPNVQEE